MLLDRTTHTIGALRQASSWLFDACSNAEFCKRFYLEKSQEFGWASTWTKELHPLERFAFHQRLADDAQFRLRAEGAPIDADILLDGAWQPLQITLAFPQFDGPAEQDAAGYQRRLHTEVLLGEGKATWGHRYRRYKGRTTRTGRRGSFWKSDIEAICKEGIESALKRKSDKVGPGCHLLIYCMDFPTLGTFKSIASEAAAKYSAKLGNVAIFGDAEESFHWRRSATS